MKVLSKYYSKTMLLYTTIVLGVSIALIAVVMSLIESSQTELTIDLVATVIGIGLLVVIFIIVIDALFKMKKLYSEHQMVKTEIDHLVEERINQSCAKSMEEIRRIISHDLRAPLRSIVGFSQILIEDISPRLDVDEQEVIEKIVAGGKKMGTMINNVCELCKPTSDDKPKVNVNISELAHITLIELREVFPQSDFNWNIQDNLYIHADSSLAKLIIYDLFSEITRVCEAEEKHNAEFGAMQKEDKVTFFVRTNNINEIDGKSYFIDRAKMCDKNDVANVEADKYQTLELKAVRHIIEREGGKLYVEFTDNKCAGIYFQL